MTKQSAISLHDSRLMRLVRQYKRLLERYQNQRCEVQLQEVADTLACSPRYARTLLKEMKLLGWISWASLPGRGKTSLIQCRLDSDDLHDVSVATPAAEPVTQLPPLFATAGGYHFIFPYYRPISPIIPSLSAQHLTRHLIRMVHIGLMRYEDGNITPVFALAHHVTSSADRMSWRFYIRPGLVWHNNDLFSIADGLRQLQLFAGTPALPYVKNISADDQSIVFHLTQPDEMLLHRLANPVISLSHPIHPTVGLGPFMVVSHTDELISLARAPYWYGEMPMASRITLETRLRNTKDWGVVTLETEDSTLHQEAGKMLTSNDTFSFLAYNHNTSVLTRQHRITLSEIAKNLALSLVKKQSDLLPIDDWLTMSGKKVDAVDLPSLLSMAYFSTPDTEVFVRLFSRYLLRMGCRLKLRPIHNTHWPAADKTWEGMDLALGYLSCRKEAAFTFEERWRRSGMIKTFWPIESQQQIMRLLDSSVMRTPTEHKQCLIALQRRAIRHRLIAPLYLKRYTLHYPQSVKGIHCHPQCWPDFSRLWIDDADKA